MSPQVLISDCATGLAITLYNGPVAHTIPLIPQHAERTISGILLALKGGASHTLLIPHARDHQTQPEASCRFCALEGRVLKASGRRTITAEERIRAQAAAATKRGDSKVQIKRYPAGLSGAQILSLQERGATPRAIRKEAERHMPASTVMRAEDML